MTKKQLAYLIPVLAGLVFCFYYVRTACLDVAYTDYVRLILSYLPDVMNPDKFLVPDILTRVPVTYLARIVNVKFFGYSTLFDISLGVLSLGLGGFAMARYMQRQGGFAMWILWVFLSVLYFGLNQWEMITNGTGWVCFLSISGFIGHFVLIDRIAASRGEVSGKDVFLLCLVPLVLDTLVAGPYCGGYSVILVLTYLGLMFRELRKKTYARETGHTRRNRFFAWFLSAAAAVGSLALYLWSNHFAVYEHRGATDRALLDVAKETPSFFAQFLLKAFASDVIGLNQVTGFMNRSENHMRMVYVLGGLVILAYLAAVWLNWKMKITADTIFPLIMVLSGGLNHLLILVSRWIFMNPDYGMSSRYALQYKMGVIGIVLTFAMAARIRRSGVYAFLLTLSILVFGAGSLWTTYKELETAPYRKEYLERARKTGLNYRNESDEVLAAQFQHSGAKVREALRILEANRLNIFR